MCPSSLFCEWRFAFYGDRRYIRKVPWCRCQFLQRASRNFAVTEIPVSCFNFAFIVSRPTFSLSIIICMELVFSCAQLFLPRCLCLYLLQEVVMILYFCCRWFPYPPPPFRRRINRHPYQQNSSQGIPPKLCFIRWIMDAWNHCLTNAPMRLSWPYYFMPWEHSRIFSFLLR